VTRGRPFCKHVRLAFLWCRLHKAPRSGAGPRAEVTPAALPSGDDRQENKLFGGRSVDAGLMPVHHRRAPLETRERYHINTVTSAACR